MKIDTTARIANLAHQDYFVRNTLLDCCLKFGDTDIRVTQQAMIAIDSYGIEQAYEYPHKLRVLALDEAAADWLIALIDQLDSKTHFGNNCLAHFVDWFVSKAPTSSLVKYRAHIINLPANNQQFKRNNPDEELTIRAELNALTSDQAYQKIVSQLETLDEYTSFKEANIPHLERLIQQLDPSDDSLKQNILTKLQSTLPEPGSDKAFQAHYWDFGIWVIASGYLKIDQAIPTLLAGINYDWDWLNELIPEAIVKIGSEAALKLTTDLCLQSQQESAKMNDAYDYKRTFLTCVFEKVESPLSAALAQKLLINEREEFALSSLAEAIAVQLDGESIHHALAVYNEYPNEPEFGHLIGYFYTHAILTDSTPSDLDQWKDKLDQERKSSFQMRHQGYSEDSMLAQLMQRQNSSPFKFPKYAPAKEIPTYIRTEAKINRNDPCPCGSGQKYKRCCIN